MGAFLYTAGVINELTEFVRSHKEVGGGLMAFERAFNLVDEGRVEDATRHVLHVIRNRQAFHFDPTVAERVIPRLPPDDYPLVVGHGPERLAANYELADIATIAFVFGHLDNVAKLYEEFERFCDDLSRLVIRFIEAADDVIIERLLARGGTSRERTPEPPSSTSLQTDGRPGLRLPSRGRAPILVGGWRGRSVRCGARR